MLGETLYFRKPDELEKYLDQLEVGDQLYDLSSRLFRQVASIERDENGGITAIDWKWGVYKASAKRRLQSEVRNT